jgi:hypothetical protein
VVLKVSLAAQVLKAIKVLLVLPVKEALSFLRKNLKMLNQCWCGVHAVLPVQRVAQVAPDQLALLVSEVVSYHLKSLKTSSRCWCAALVGLKVPLAVQVHPALPVVLVRKEKEASSFPRKTPMKQTSSRYPVSVVHKGLQVAVEAAVVGQREQQLFHSAPFPAPQIQA